DPVSVETEDLRRLFHRPENGSGKHGRTHRIQAELELGHDPEVASRSADPPEEVGVLGLACLDQLPVRRDELNTEQLVDREAVLPHQPPDAATERETRETGAS